jgi:hypothetical protein
VKKLIVFCLAIVLLQACKNNDEVLLRVNANRKITDSYSIHNISRVGNYTVLADSDAMVKYFAPKEVEEMLKSTDMNIYGVYKVFETPTYKLAALVQVQKYDTQENYYYYLRTYKKNGEMIGHYDFAAWDSRQSAYCSSTLTNKYEIKRDCGMGEESWKVTNEGEFESVPTGE